MKQIAKHLLGIIIVSLTISCTKDNNLSDTDNIPGLPPVTQIGANTFGCLVNGKPWVPSGNNGTANLSIDYDPGINNGGFGISAYKVLSNIAIEYIDIGSWNLNSRIAPFDIDLGNPNTSYIAMSKSIGCVIMSNDTLVKKSGTIFFDYYNKQTKIIAGRFEAVIYKNGCDTMKISHGRFDFKF